jgi:DNA-cytosine methyltransferase
MPHDLTHASFFSGVGGLDLGLERAGWRTVSLSEIDPYASAVLAERWPGVPNLGDITELARSERVGAGGNAAGIRPRLAGSALDDERGVGWPAATLWTGGFPCQDLSVAGKRRGMGTEDDRTRSGLAYAFLDLVERHRPPAILLENVPGLLSSNGGKDLGALLGRLGELGYWWAYRILDAQFFGVPQRRRRVFILAFHAESGLGADSAAAVLSVGSRCVGHSQAGDEAREGVAGGAPPGPVETVGAIPAGVHGFPDGVQEFMQGHFRVVSPSPDSGGVREADGLAGRVDDSRFVGFSENQRGELVEHDIAHQLTGGGGKPGQGYPAVFRKSARVSTPDSDERWVDDGLANTINTFESTGVRTTHAVVGGGVMDDPMLPTGLDSHRYRCVGNGVVAPVSRWIGERLAAAVQSVSEVAA